MMLEEKYTAKEAKGTANIYADMEVARITREIDRYAHEGRHSFDMGIVFDYVAHKLQDSGFKVVEVIRSGSFSHTTISWE